MDVVARNRSANRVIATAGGIAAEELPAVGKVSLTVHT